MPDLPLMNLLAIDITRTGSDDQVSWTYRLRLFHREDLRVEVVATDCVPRWFGTGLNIADREPLLEMKFPRPAVIIEAVGDIGVLLNLRESDACSDSMYRSGGNEPGFTGDSRQPAEMLHDAAVFTGGPQLFGGEGPA